MPCSEPAPRVTFALSGLLRRVGLSLLAAASVGSAGAEAATLTLRAGQSAGVGGARVTLLGVTDSRCPPRALCVMAGNVTARVFVVRGHSARLYTVFLPGQAVRTSAGVLRLTAATRREDGPPRLTFRVTR